MSHLQILLGLIILIVGGVAISQLVFQAQRRPLAFLRTFIRFLLIFNLYFFLQTALEYFYTNIQPGMAPGLYFWISAGTDLLFSLILLLITWLGMGLAYRLIGSQPPRRLRLGYGLMALIVLVVHLLLLLANSPRLNMGPLFKMMVVYVLIFHLFIPLTFARVYRDNAGKLPGSQRRLLGQIALWVAAVKGLSLLCLFLFYRAILSFNISFYAVFLLYNLLPLLTFTRVAQTFFPETKSVLVPTLDEHCARFGISKREQEIVALVLEGCSNRDIEERLFISLATVKDHIYKIYKKTGVKNRVQLVNLFSENSAKP